MTFLFFVILSIAFVILQTSVMPGLPFFNQFFDLLIPVVLSLSLRFSHVAVILGVIFLGLIMDSVSGGPFGLYLSAYVWTYIAVQLFKGLVHSENIIFLYVACITAVILENGMALFCLAVQNGRSVFSSPDIGFMGQQILWTLFVMPVTIIFIEVLHRWFLFSVKLVAHKAREMNK